MMKKNLRPLLLLLLASLLLPAALTSAVSAEAGDPYYHGELKQSLYWDTRTDNNEYASYRLPSIVVTKKDTVIVYGEARRANINNDGWGGPTNGDAVEMDLYLRRSTDGGETFGERIWIAKGREYYANGYGETINNPVITVGNDGRLHLLFNCNASVEGMFYCYSDDDGVTWTEPKDITEQFSNLTYKLMAFGPGHGVCLENGTMVVPAWVYNGSYFVYSIYSDDNGATWKVGQRVSENKDETCIAITSGGGTVMNSRQYSTPSASSPYRRLSYSANGYKGWSKSVANETLIDPACCGGMTSVDLEGLPFALLFVNNASKTSRNHLTVRCSFNDGVTWEKSLLLNENEGGYSDIAVDSKGKVYVVYEEAVGSRVRLATFSFYDVFCKGDDSLFAGVTKLQPTSMQVSSKNGVLINNTDDGRLGVTVHEDNRGKASVVIDVNSVTKAINVSERPVMALRFTGAVGNTSQKCGVFFRCGGYTVSDSKLYSSFEAVPDGKERTVFLDLSSRETYGGVLTSLELEFYSADLEPVTGESYVIGEIAFFESMEEALKAYPADREPSTETEPPSTQAPTPTTDPAGGENGKEGCGSSLSVGAVLLSLLPVAALPKLRRSKERT